jgi:hypothetical protein
MNCANHPEIPAGAYCRACGKALCEACQRTASGTIFCEEHMPAPTIDMNASQAGYSPYTAPPTAAQMPPQRGVDISVSPGLAFILGFIPGVGAIYNAQYAKGLIHVLVLGVLISIISSGSASGLEPLFGILIGVFFCYMPFEAYHTAKKRQMGEPVDEFSSIIPMHGQGRFPVAPMVLIGLGILFLLINFDLLRFRDVVRYWPIFLIALGAYMLYSRLAGNDVPPGPDLTAGGVNPGGFSSGGVNDERR